MVAKESEEIIYHNTEKVDRSMQQGMDSKFFTDPTLKISNKIKTLQSLSKGVVDNHQTFHVDPTILSIRLLVLLERSDNAVRYFTYELTSYPTPLFQDYFMRQPDKSLLMYAILIYKNDNEGKKRKK